MVPDHIHMMISIPAKYSVAEVVVGYMKGKSVIAPDFVDLEMNASHFNNLGTI